MRISDWSSDVCSSDRAANKTGSCSVTLGSFSISVSRRCRHGEDPTPCCHPGQRPQGHESRRPTVAQNGSRMPLRAFGTTTREIGRASCRERVWQYVEITVVDVSLKKTTTKQKK